MTVAEYRQHTLRTLPDLGDSFRIHVKNLSHRLEISLETQIETTQKIENIADKLNLTHMALGLAGEIGELTECVGTGLKFEIDRVNLCEELGDIYWYLANYCNMRELDLPEEPLVEVKVEDAFDHLIIKISDLVDIVKRYMAYNKPIEKSKEMNAVYDIRVALYLFEELYDFDGADIRSKNIAKLIARFPEKFTDELAINRNLDNEHKALE